LRQISRNPSFYIDQAIANVGRHLTGGRVLGENPRLMPYSKERAQTILQALADTEKVLAQGTRNLIEMVPELADVALHHPGGAWPSPDWEKGQLKYIVENYRKRTEVTSKFFPPEEAKRLIPAAVKAGEYLLEFGK